MMYRLDYTPAAAKQIRKLDPRVRARVLAAAGRLRDDPRPPALRQMVDRPGERRLRVGDYRVIYEVVDQQVLVLVLRVGHRREIYS